MDSSESMPDLFHNEESLMAYDSRCGYNTLTEQETMTQNSPSSYEDRFYSFPEAKSFIQNFLQEDNLSYSSSPDDLEATSAVFQQFDAILRQQVHTEIEVFKENINRILTDQQFQFKQVFGLPDSTLNTTEAMHVVPQSSYEKEKDSEEYQPTNDTAESESNGSAVERLQWYHLENYPSEESFPSQEVQDVAQDDKEKLVLEFVVRMLTADCAITAALRRKEYVS